MLLYLIILAIAIWIGASVYRKSVSVKNNSTEKAVRKKRSSRSVKSLSQDGKKAEVSFDKNGTVKLKPEELNDIRSAYDRILIEINQDSTVVNGVMAKSMLDFTYNLGIDPEPLLIYELARVYDLPITDFYKTHKSEIVAALSPMLNCEWISGIAKDKQQSENEVTDYERKHFHSYAYEGSTIQYYDIDASTTVRLRIKK